MGICSYLVIPEPGEGEAVCGRLAGLPGCDVLPAENHELLVLVADTLDAREEQALRDRVEGLDGVQALVLTFAEVTSP